MFFWRSSKMTMTNLFSFIPLSYLAAHPEQNTTKFIIKANVVLQDGCREERVAKISQTHIATRLRVENLKLKKIRIIHLKHRIWAIIGNKSSWNRKKLDCSDCTKCFRRVPAKTNYIFRNMKWEVSICLSDFETQSAYLSPCFGFKATRSDCVFVSKSLIFYTRTDMASS